MKKVVLLLCLLFVLFEGIGQDYINPISDEEYIELPEEEVSEDVLIIEREMQEVFVFAERLEKSRQRLADKFMEIIRPYHLRSALQLSRIPKQESLLLLIKEFETNNCIRPTIHAYNNRGGFTKGFWYSAFNVDEALSIDEAESGIVLNLQYFDHPTAKKYLLFEGQNNVQSLYLDKKYITSNMPQVLKDMNEFYAPLKFKFPKDGPQLEYVKASLEEYARSIEESGMKDELCEEDEEEGEKENDKDYTIIEVKKTPDKDEDDIFVTIGVTPSMPKVKIKPVLDAADWEKEVTVQLKVEYKRDIREDEDYFPAKPIVIKKEESWTIDWNKKIRGGNATIIVKIGKDTEIKKVFYIRGINPTEQVVKDYIVEKNYDDIWFFTRLIMQESSYRQFNIGKVYGKNGDDWNKNLKGCPNFGPPHGWGLTQLDNLNASIGNHQKSGGWRPEAEALWNWKKNIDLGVRFLREVKRLEIRNKFNEFDRVLSRWYLKNSTDLVDGQADQTEGNITFTHANNDDFPDFDFGEELSNDKKSFADACWIKHYNGSSKPGGGRGGYYYKLEQEYDDVVEEYTKPYWNIQNLNINNENYVEMVCNRAE